MNFIYDIVNSYTSEIVFAAIILSLISFILILINYFRTSKILRKYKRLMRGADNKNLEAMMYNHLESIQEGLGRLKDVELAVSSIVSRLDGCVQRVGVIRYNAFDQMGGDQSYSIALLDEHGSGFVLTGLYSRNTSTTFAKPVQQRQSKYPLSLEETQAIERAFSK